MADVKIVDIDNEQWFMKDQYAREQISALGTRLDGYKTIRHDIEARPPQETNNIWSCLMNQIIATDWSFLTDDVYAYGKFTILTIGWGNYKAIKFTDGTIILSGILEYGIEPHTFEAVSYPQSNAWHFSVDGEGLSYLQNNILVTYKMCRVNNGFGIPREVFVRNIAQTTIGNLYAALEANGLLNRPSTGILIWDLQRQHDGVDLPKFHVGYLAYATSEEFAFSGRGSFESVKIGVVDQQNNNWIFDWNNGGNCYETNMYGEPLEGIVPTVSLAFTV